MLKDYVPSLLAITKRQVFLYGVIATIFLEIGSIAAIFIDFFGSSKQRLNNLQHTLTTHLAVLNHIPFGGELAIVMFWVILGVVCYLIGLFLVNVVVTARNLTVVELEGGRKLPKLEVYSYMQRLRERTFYTVAVTLFIIITILSLWILFPTWVLLWQQFLVAPTSPQSFLFVAVAIGGTMTNLYLFIIYGRLLRLRYYFFEQP